MQFDDDRLDRPPPLVTLTCPDCPAKVTGQGENHARALLAIHQEGTCQGREEVNGQCCT